MHAFILQTIIEILSRPARNVDNPPAIILILRNIKKVFESGLPISSIHGVEIQLNSAQLAPGRSPAFSAALDLSRDLYDWQTPN